MEDSALSTSKQQALKMSTATNNNIPSTFAAVEQRKPPPPNTTTSDAATSVARAAATVTPDPQEEADRQLAQALHDSELEAAYLHIYNDEQPILSGLEEDELEETFRPVLELVWPEVYCTPHQNHLTSNTALDQKKPPPSSSLAQPRSTDPAAGVASLDPTKSTLSTNGHQDSNRPDDLDASNTLHEESLSPKEIREGLYQFGVLQLITYLKDVAGCYELDDLVTFVDPSYYEEWSNLPLWDGPHRFQLFHLVCSFIDMYGADMFQEHMDHCKDIGYGGAVLYIVRAVRQGIPDERISEEEDKKPAAVPTEKGDKEDDPELAAGIAMSLAAVCDSAVAGNETSGSENYADTSLNDPTKQDGTPTKESDTDHDAGSAKRKAECLTASLSGGADDAKDERKRATTSTEAKDALGGDKVAKT